MVDTFIELYTFFISFVALSLTIAAIVIWIMLMINKKEEESFDEKYRRTRKHDGYKSGR
jgi:hypothetical protein